MCVKILLAALQPGDRPLQKWIRHQVRCVGQARFGTSSFAALISGSRLSAQNLSPVMNNIFRAWNTFSPFLELPGPSMLSLPSIHIWGDPRATSDATPLVGKTVLSTLLRLMISPRFPSFGPFNRTPGGHWGRSLLFPHQPECALRIDSSLLD